MKCPKCGAELTEDTNFCSYCGTKIEHDKKREGPEFIEVPDYLASNNKALNGMGQYDNKGSSNRTVGQKMKDSVLASWKKLPAFCKMLAVHAVIFFVLLLVSVCSHKVFPIVFSCLQLVGILIVFLMHKEIIKMSPQKAWIKFLVLAVAVLFSVMNVWSYSWGGHHASDPKVPEIDENSASEVDADKPEAKIYIPFSSDVCVEMLVSEIKAELQEAGFTDIETEPAEDLLFKEADQLDKVKSVQIGSSDAFSEGQAFSEDAKVRITYHAYKKCSLNLNIDFLHNLIFSKYDVYMTLDGGDRKALVHGEDATFEFEAIPGDHTIKFVNKEDSSVYGEITVSVKGDVNAELQISCTSDDVNIETIYWEDPGAVGENEVMLTEDMIDLISCDYNDARLRLEEAGFYQIKMEAQYDVSADSTELGQVTELMFDGVSDYKRGDIFSNDAEIVISYHAAEEEATPSEEVSEENNKDISTAQPVVMPENSDAYLGMNYTDVEKIMTELGFTSIETIEWTTTDTSYVPGEVFNIRIDRSEFSEGDTFDSDQDVKIEYFVIKEAPAEDDMMPEISSDAVYYASQSREVAMQGNSGVFSYKMRGKIYDQYYIINFDEGYVYYFTDGNGNEQCDRVRITSGNLNDVLIITYHDGNDVWEYGLHFHYKDNPECLIMQDNDGFESKFDPTDLREALEIMSTKTLHDY